MRKNKNNIKEQFGHQNPVLQKVKSRRKKLAKNIFKALYYFGHKTKFKKL